MENLGMTTTRVHFFFPKAILPHHSPVGFYSVGFVCLFFTWIGSEYKMLQIIWLVIQPENRAHGFPEALLSVAQSTDHHRTRDFAGHLRGRLRVILIQLACRKGLRFSLVAAAWFNAVAILAFLAFFFFFPPSGRGLLGFLHK